MNNGPPNCRAGPALGACAANLPNTDTPLTNPAFPAALPITRAYSSATRFPAPKVVTVAAGHSLMTEAPDAVLFALADFLKA